MTQHNNLQQIAKLIFPHWKSLLSVVELEAMFPMRDLADNAMVTRVGPSPTGMMHIGGLYVSLINDRLAKQSNGLFFLRVEDTDQARTIDGAFETIVNSLHNYELTPDEGHRVNQITEIGDYGPYIQSQRKSIYDAVAYDMLCRGVLYPCFISTDELDAIRQSQIAQGVQTGVYGEWANRYRTVALIEKLLNDNQSYVLRFRSPGHYDSMSTWTDMIRGDITNKDNCLDTVLIKSDRMPTYHFAHVVDDHFMRTTDVIRGEEWLSSTPLHLQLFNAMNWDAPKYSHVGAIHKIGEDGKKRKISKRLDAEANVEYYWDNGFVKDAVIEYLLNLANSNFEDWRAKNSGVNHQSFEISIKNMSSSDPLFDIVKLENINKRIISEMKSETLYDLAYQWALKHDQPLASTMANDPIYATKAMDIERTGAKRLITLVDIKAQLKPFFDEFLPDDMTFPDNVTVDDRIAILTALKDKFHETTKAEDVFGIFQEIASSLGFAVSTKEYKANKDSFKGQVADIAMIVRIAIFGDVKSPDLGQTLTVLGSEAVKRRCDRVIRKLREDFSVEQCM